MADSENKKTDQPIGNFSKELRLWLGQYSDSDCQFIEKAFNFAKEKHANQKRISGEPYFIHPLSIAQNIAKLTPDANTVAAALLHDVVEDCDVEISEIASIFNLDTAKLVEGVTNISSIEMKEKALGLEFSKNHFTSQVDSYRKLLTAMAGDPRVLVIKLYDRLHNAQTLQWLSENRRGFYALETIEIYAILAERIGMGDIKRQLEDLCFPYAYPLGYKKYLSTIEAEQNKSQALVEEKIFEIKNNIPRRLILECYGRVKHKFSTYKKLEERDFDFSTIHDSVALRVISSSVDDCYRVLGLINTMYEPIDELHRDFIARPKSNGYQSLHTTVRDKNGGMFEVQIRTPEMHQIAEHGIAAHWSYKEVRYGRSNLKETGSWQENAGFDNTFFANKIYVFSPQGKIIELPKNSTPLDFAFHIHTQLGLSCIGSKVNGKIVPISSRLKTGDIVEVIKNERTKPSRDWLSFVKTNFARSKIREYFSDLERPRYYAEGLEALNTALAKLDRSAVSDKNSKSLSDRISNSKLPFNDLYTAVVAIGKKDISKNDVIKALYPDVDFSEKKIIKRAGSKKTIRLEIGDGFSYRLANCCKPKQNDEVIGYITLQKTITIHKTSCREVRKFDKERIIDAGWK